jgi:acetyl esterase/lipase
MQEQWRRVFSLAAATGGAWVHAPLEKNDRGDLQRLPPLFIVFAGGDTHRDLQQEKRKTQAVDFKPFLFFKYALGLPLF